MSEPIDKRRCPVAGTRLDGLRALLNGGVWSNFHIATKFEWMPDEGENGKWGAWVEETQPEPDPDTAGDESE